MPSTRLLPLTLLLSGLAATHAYGQAELPVIHISDYLAGLDASKNAIEEFRTMSSDGRHAAAAAASYELGDVRSFKVYNHVESERKNSTVLESLGFTLMAEHDRFLIWVETKELENGHVRERDIADLKRALGNQTPDGSVDTGAGIIENNETIFGSPPDVDRDDRTDILLVDIRDGWKSGDKSGYVAGFVFSGDLTSTGNRRDVLYVDVYPGLYRDGKHVSTTGLETTVAHEYQHLIHFNYDLQERTFVNEGLAEWASVMNGYRPRSVSYLTNTSEHGIALFAWREGAEVLNDYQRAGLFTAYLAQRLGPEATGSIVRARSGSILKGEAGYRQVAKDHGYEMEDLITDFHATNLFNDEKYGGEFFHMLESQRSIRAIPTFAYGGTDEVNRKDFPLNAGAVQYFEWTNVRDLTFDVDVSSTTPSSLLSVARDRLRLVVITEGTEVETQRFDIDGRPIRLEGSYSRITAVLVHVKPDEKGVRLDLSAHWGEASGVAAAVEEIPAQVGLDQNYPNPFNPQTLIRYQLSMAADVRLTIFDVLGRRMAVLVDSSLPAGHYEEALDASTWPSGTYLYVLETGSERLQRSMTLAR